MPILLSYRHTEAGTRAIVAKQQRGKPRPPPNAKRRNERQNGSAPSMPALPPRERQRR